MEMALNPEFEKLASADEQEFYELAVNYFYPKKADYSVGYHFFHFVKIDSIYKIKSHQFFEAEPEFRTYRRSLYSNQFHFVIMKNQDGLNLFFKCDYLVAHELLNDINVTCYYDFKQDLKNYFEKGIPRPKLDFDVKEVLDNMLLRAIKSPSVKRSKKRLAS